VVDFKGVHKGAANDFERHAVAFIIIKYADD